MSNQNTQLVTGQFTVTTDAVAKTISTFSTVAGKAYMVLVDVIGIRVDGASAYTEGASYRRVAAFRNNAGTLTQISTTQASFTAEDDAAWDCTVATSGTDIIVAVTGAAAKTINWRCDYVASPLRVGAGYQLS